MEVGLDIPILCLYLLGVWFCSVLADAKGVSRHVAVALALWFTPLVVLPVLLIPVPIPEVVSKTLNSDSAVLVGKAMTLLMAFLAVGALLYFPVTGYLAN